MRKSARTILKSVFYLKHDTDRLNPDIKPIFIEQEENEEYDKIEDKAEQRKEKSSEASSNRDSEINRRIHIKLTKNPFGKQPKRNKLELKPTDLTTNVYESRE